jgi:hypothetical protein
VRPRSLLCAALVLAGSPAAARASEGGIAVDVPAAGCPGRAPLVAALEARLPRVTATPGRRLELAPNPGGPLLRLRAPSGAVELERQLSLDQRAPSGDACEALAEAAAVVVVRYLREIGYQPPPLEVPATSAEVPATSAEVPATSAAPPPAVTATASAGFLGLGSAVRLGDTGAEATRGELMLALQLHRRRLAAELAAGETSEIVAEVPATSGAQLRVRSYPLRVGVGVPFVIGPGTLVPAVGASLDVLSFRASGLTEARRGVRLEPAVELGAGYLAGRTLFLRLGLAGGLTLGARDFDAGQAAPVFRTPDAYLRAQIEVGVVLWKNRPSP